MTLSNQAKEVAANHFLSYYPQATGAAAYDAFVGGIDATEGMLIWQPHAAAGYDKLCELMEKLATDVQQAMQQCPPRDVLIAVARDVFAACEKEEGAIYGIDLSAIVDHHAGEVLSGAATDPWQPSGAEYDRSVHHCPDAKAWADLFVQTYPGLADKHDLMLGWFANAMMAMHDHLGSQRANTNPATVPDDAIDAVSIALRKAWQLGQRYWQQADSTYRSENGKAGATHAKFDALVDETRAMLRTVSNDPQE